MKMPFDVSTLFSNSNTDNDNHKKQNYFFIKIFFV